ncbi:MAG: hypothetical protein BM555_05145 [Crocinitomix sp. MedPE-SWsnd]|nr:MAG: hypothetical protein BM555_05145 [Crocinitomix sp. MedPE-SWsnd]
MFPYYRKLIGKDIYYKIVSDEEFHEITKVKGRLNVELVMAIQYPEKLRIQDMITCHGNYYEKVDEKHYSAWAG